MERKPIGKKVRFEVFKRDSFTCQYCGKGTPHVVLELDHIIPVSKGGDNNIINLVTACFDCNRGKGKTELSAIPESLEDKIYKSNLREQQYKEYQNLLKKIDKNLVKEVGMIESLYMYHFEEYKFTDKFKISVKNFISHLGYDEVRKSLEYAIWKSKGNCLTYFCAICWNKIKLNNITNHVLDTTTQAN